MKVLFTSDHLVKVGDKTDEASSMVVFRNILQEFLANEEAQQDKIQEAVHRVFDLYKGTAMNVDFIRSQALAFLRATPDSATHLSKLVEQYIRDNSDQLQVVDKKTKVVLTEAEAPRTRLFSAIKRGNTGGIRRWSDVPADSSEAKPSDKG